MISSALQFYCHFITNSIQSVEPRQHCNACTQRNRNPDETDFNIGKRLSRLLHIRDIPAVLQERADYEAGQTHAAFYKESLKGRNQAGYACVLFIFRVVNYIRLRLLNRFSREGRASSIGSPERMPRIPTRESHSVRPRLYLK